MRGFYAFSLVLLCVTVTLIIENGVFLVVGMVFEHLNPDCCTKKKLLWRHGSGPVMCLNKRRAVKFVCLINWCFCSFKGNLTPIHESKHRSWRTVLIT